MKFASLVLLIILVGCASRTTTEDLKDEALTTGDWSAVEDRERMNKEMRVAPKPKCPEHLMLICIKNGEYEDCSCLSPH